jgi:hypothetical protein
MPAMGKKVYFRTARLGSGSFVGQTAIPKRETTAMRNKDGHIFRNGEES